MTEFGIPVYSANVKEPFGLIDKDLLQDFSQPSVLWGIDGDWMVNTIPANTPFYPTDHTGVLRIDNENIHYRYLAYKLEQAGIKEGFSRSYRASIGKIKKLSFKIPSIEEQNNAMEKVNYLENLILAEQDIISDTQDKKIEIIKKYLI